MKYRIAKLEGALLDAAVAKAEAVDWRWFDGFGSMVYLTDGARSGQGHYPDAYSPSKDWQHCGPIIYREQISVISPDIANMDRARHIKDWQAQIPGTIDGQWKFAVERGPTPMVAAMRALVASRFGDEVEMP